jgi:hypothetical protein
MSEIKHTGVPNIAESFLPRNFGDIGHFRRYGDRNKFLFKMKKRVGVRNDVMCRDMKLITKMRRITYSVKRNQIKV